MNKYYNKNYIKKQRFINYWNQINEILNLNPENILEIGVGNKIVCDILKKFNLNVKTLDIDRNLKPDFIGSVEDLSFLDETFDLILAAEILEHLPFEKFEISLKQIYQKTNKWTVVSLPYKGFILGLFFKIPFLKWVRLMFKFPYFWQTMPNTKEHYWEIGLKNYSIKTIKKIIKQTNFKIKKTFYSKDDPDRYFFVLEK